METHRLVLPEDLNHYGYLFGGRLLSWVDEASWIAASLDFPGSRFVTVSMDQVIFRHSVREGSILIIRSKRGKIGKTSVSYGVEVLRGQSASDEVIFSTQVTFVNLNEEGVKSPVEYGV